MKLIKRLKTKRHMKVRVLGEYGNAINLSLFWRIFRPKENINKNIKIKHNTATESTSDDPKGQSLIGYRGMGFVLPTSKNKKVLGAS
jgi:hypothetical protein